MKYVVLNVLGILGLGLIIGLALRPSPRRTADEAAAPEMRQAPGSAAKVAQSTEPIVGTGEPVPTTTDEEWLSRFELTERSGETVSSDQLEGRPYVVSFFFTTCPSICVMQNQKLRELQEEFAGADVRFLSISVDPETDDPEALRAYAKRFGADEDQWLFLTGDLTYIRRVGGEMFQVAVNRKFHTEKFVLVDRDGELVEYYSWGEPRQFEKLKADIRALVDGTEPTGEARSSDSA